MQLIKIHTHAENVGAHLRSSVWHLLINLKNNYLFNKLMKLANKNVRIVIFTMFFLTRIKKKPWRSHYFTPVYQKS